jgi:hypothetical protein
MHQHATGHWVDLVSPTAIYPLEDQVSVWVKRAREGSLAAKDLTGATGQ